jgi:alginate O-acetyltransferase complex protein AlgJ
MTKIVAVLTVIFLGLVTVAVRGGEAILEVFRTSQLTDFMSGTVSGKVDKAVFEAIPKSPGLNGLASGLLYAGLHDAGSQVWAGCADWLYSIEELRVDRRDAENILFHATLLRSLVNAVAARNIFLVILPVPDKAEQVEDQLCGLRADQTRFRAKLWADATKFLEAQQIDLRKRWPRPGYWRTDTHWDRQGARFAADAVARLINEKLGVGAESVRLTTGATRERVGDLARLAGLTDSPRWLAPPYERETDERAEIQRSGGLLDDTPAPSVILAGSSYSLNSGFIEFLQASLSREVAQASQTGGGFAGALLDILERKPGALAGVRVVIWEWPMRSLTAPPTGVEQQFLKQMPGSQ